jgi:hypothetical protein
MLPLVRPGDVVCVRPLLGSEPRLGDVVAVKGMPDGGLLVHRVVRRRGALFLLRGDNTTLANGEFPRGDLLGIVSKVERNGRDVCFGAGHWGWVVGLAVRTGAINWYNRAVLKFHPGVSRLREHKGDDGNE